MAKLDVRPILAAGQEPFQRIMATVARLAPGEPLELIAPFEPVPLYGVMAQKGFRHETQPLDDGSWKVLFVRE